MALGLVLIGSGIDLLTTSSYWLHWYCLISLRPLATNQNENLTILAITCIYVLWNLPWKFLLWKKKWSRKSPWKFLSSDSSESMGTMCLMYLYQVFYIAFNKWIWKYLYTCFFFLFGGCKKKEKQCQKHKLHWHQNLTHEGLSKMAENWQTTVTQNLNTYTWRPEQNGWQ